MSRYIITLAVIFLHIKLISARRNVSEDVIFRFYTTSPNSYNEINITRPEKLLTLEGYDKNKNTVFYSCGFEELMNWESVQTVLKAYLERKDHNVIIVDWSNMNQGNYVFQAIPNMHKVAKTFADAIFILLKSGMSKDKIHLVGHSLGAQLSGMTGKNLRKRYNTLIYRITHLDAAGPVFYFPFVQHATKYDAEFVDSIHTDALIMGYIGGIGTIEFWPNRGMRHQPGCPFTIPFIWPFLLSPEALCSHWRSWRYWAESLKNPKAFMAKRCGIFNNVQKYTTEVSYMGIAASPKSTGDFCLTTSSQSPFGLGEKGVM